MAATPSVKIVKTFPYKAGSKVWSNRYHFSGGTPANDAAWHTLMDAVVAAEKTIFDSTVEIIEAVGYDAGSDVPVSSKAYTATGTLSGTADRKAPGECAALMRYTTTQKTTKNHPVYLFNYWHGCYVGASPNEDTLQSAQVTAMNAYADDWLAGFSDGTLTLVRAGPNGAVAQTRELEPYITHRDFRN